MSERAPRGGIRRGLPRVKGGEAWPPASAVEAVDAASGAEDRLLSEEAVQPAGSGAVAASAPAASVAAASVAVDAAPEAAAAQAAAEPASGSPSTLNASAPAASLRRGLPRVAGGEPWPPASAAAPASASSAGNVVESTTASPEESVPPAASDAVAGESAPVVASGAAPSAASDAPPAAAAVTADGTALRRGLPRAPGGDPWPPAGVARIAEAGAASTGSVTQGEGSATQGEGSATRGEGSATRAAASVQGAVAVASAQPDVSTPLPYTRTVWAGTAPRRIAASDDQPARRKPTWPQAIGGLLGLAALGLVAVAGVFLVRAFLSIPFMQDFLTTYPGEYHVDVAPGFAPWVGWQHFFNMFLMVLIIRSGLRVRTEKRPTAFWTPRRNAKGKISLTLWFHQSLDILWMINGVVFVILLFVTGHWLRLVPTSWEVFPNALSAGLQYLSFDWPTDNGWVNYNSLQQLAYFATVFIAAPLAAITGFRMSGLWPKNAEKLSKAYPVEWARALHFPIMLYFVVFIIVHVALVFLTGALRNLNHMFAAQGSVDGAEYAANWTGFGVFVLAVAVIVAAWFAARPLILAPIAKLFGQVSGR
ncbi:cytochrome b/b6 domain-containing protein [Microbacterium sp. ARD32]|uniref:cytochrome b/b6 domain-containing protein n=1 Tax=Microbacterium sp. ARD32 TaxID=2962577 RepID=UPI002881C7A7|nr:cytochrome b/b6 domain-containing protein [Microbacterium sp. ARD32]MDT0158158.1 cytochrome b/b6 domain-containing protein [Microbacterium sp. ARD32]